MNDEYREISPVMEATPAFPEEFSRWYYELMLAKENVQVVGCWYCQPGPPH